MYRNWIKIALLGLVIIITSAHSRIYMKKKVELAKGSCFRLQCFKGRKNGSSAYFIANTAGEGLKKRHLLIGGRLWEMHNEKYITVEETNNMFIFNFCNLTANDSGEYVCKLINYGHDNTRKFVNKTKIELRVVNLNRKYTDIAVVNETSVRNSTISYSSIGKSNTIDSERYLYNIKIAYETLPATSTAQNSIIINGLSIGKIWWTIIILLISLLILLSILLICFLKHTRRKKKKKNLYIEGCRFDFTSDLPDIAKYGTVEKDKSNERNLNYRKALDCQNNLNIKVNKKNEEVEESIKLWPSTQDI